MIGCYGDASRYADIAWEMAESSLDSQEMAVWPSYYSADEDANLKSFIRYAYMGSYGLYWALRQKMEQKIVEPSELFFASSVRSDLGEDVYSFDEAFKEWYSSYLSLLGEYEVDYRIVDRESRQSYTNAAVNLEQYEGDASAPFFLKLTFDEEGSLSILFGDSKLNAGEIRGLTKERFLSWIDGIGISGALFSQPVNTELYLYSENQDCYYSKNETIQYPAVMYQSAERAMEEPVNTAYLILLALAALLAVLFPPFWRLRREKVWITALPAEMAVGGILIALAGQGIELGLCRSYVNEEGSILMASVSFVMNLVIFGVWFVSVLVVCRMRDMGFVRFWKEKSIVFRNADQIKKAGRALWKRGMDSIRNVDLSDQSDQWLLRVVWANFLILSLCCMIWFWGILGTLVYSICLFVILRRYLNRVKKNYETLLLAARQMAEGNFHMEPTGDLGMFAPLGEELARVNEGFSRAVEEELHSRNMKTELITNVSHDLKTPLTAIITYVNLLKDESITEEERRSYIEILDRKSLRLKKLIEDLFEVSKAASGNIKIERQQVDLSEIVRQAMLEQEDRLEEAQIECRLAVPDQRVLIWLDGEKTYRILENLLVNVSKYALAGTRAWISLEADTEMAVIVVKNISATELDEDSSYLTDRFVRGDKSRNTDGSGLGLAIAKSFTELQGGRFRIVTDGDLFKAIVEFPMENGALIKTEQK